MSGLGEKHEYIESLEGNANSMTNSEMAYENQIDYAESSHVDQPVVVVQPYITTRPTSVPWRKSVQMKTASSSTNKLLQPKLKGISNRRKSLAVRKGRLNSTLISAAQRLSCKFRAECRFCDHVSYGISDETVTRNVTKHERRSHHEKFGVSYDHQCAICGESFSAIGRLRYHQSVAHPEFEEELNEESGPQNKDNLAESLLFKQFKRVLCGVDDCQVTFACNQARRRHLRKSHGLNEAYINDLDPICIPCGVAGCNKSFMSAHTRRRHLREYHEIGV